MPERAEVVVVGGGVLGCAAALELLGAGVEDVVLVERDGVATGTTDAGGGFIAMWGAVGHQSWGPDEVTMERYAIALYRGLAEEGHDIGFKCNGTLWPAVSEGAWSFVSAIADHPDVVTEVLDGGEVARLTGVTQPDAVLGAVFQPEGCQLRAGEATRALADRLARSGGRIHTGRAVTGLRTRGERVVGVETDQGVIAAGSVVLAAGAWTNEVLAGIDRWLPVVPLVTSRMTTGPLGIPPSMPAMMWAEYSGMWIREEAGGLVWGATYQADPHFALVRAEVPRRFDHLPLDGVLEVQALGAKAAEAMPVLARATDAAIAHGAPCFTDDRLALVGAMPGVAGLWVVAGCNESGLSHGPGYARVLADLVTSGRSTFVDATRFAVDRFADKFETYDDAAAAISAPLRAPVSRR